MTRQHEKEITKLQERHQAALEKFAKLPPANLEWWRSPWTTTVQQLELLESLIAQFEAGQAATATAAKNLNLTLEVIIEANSRAR